MHRYFNFIYFKLKNFILIPFILKDFILFKKKNNDKKNRFKIHVKDFYPQIRDKTKATSFDRHYLYHTAWAAREVKEINPEFHIDVASSLYFCSLVSAFVPVRFYDFRPPVLELPNLQVHHGDLMKLPFENNSVSSLSCMHTVEHIGLGRYGDPIDPDGDLKAIKELKRVLAINGSLLFVVPIGGRPKIHFNAHRIYTYDQIMNYFSDLTLKEFALIPENSGEMVSGQEAVNKLESERYGCGCFRFIKNKL